MKHVSWLRWHCRGEIFYFILITVFALAIDIYYSDKKIWFSDFFLGTITPLLWNKTQIVEETLYYSEVISFPYRKSTINWMLSAELLPKRIKTNNRRFSYVGNRELVKSIVGTKFENSHVRLHSQVGNRLWKLFVWHLSSVLVHFYITIKWFCSSLLCYDNFCTITDSGNKIKYCRLPKNSETQQEKTKENTC